MKIVFARHGESQANLLHEISNRGLRHGLTRSGRDQAAALALRLKKRAITRIYSSPVLRAIETSILVANHLNLDYEVVDALREYDCGALEGRSDEAAWQGWQALYDAWTIHQRWEQSLEGGESFFDVQKRFVPFIDGLIQQFKDSEAQILCISHGGTYRMMLPLVLNNYEEALAGHGFGYTTCLVAELRPEGLFSIERLESS